MTEIHVIIKKIVATEAVYISWYVNWGNCWNQIKSGKSSLNDGYLFKNLTGHVRSFTVER